MYSSFLVTFSIFGIFFRCVFKFSYILYIFNNCALCIQVHLFRVMYSELFSPNYSCVLVAFYILGRPCLNICGPPTPKEYTQPGSKHFTLIHSSFTMLHRMPSIYVWRSAYFCLPSLLIIWMISVMKDMLTVHGDRLFNKYFSMHYAPLKLIINAIYYFFFLPLKQTGINGNHFSWGHVKGKLLLY